MRYRADANENSLLVPRRDLLNSDPPNFQAVLDRTKFPHNLICANAFTNPAKRGEWLRVRNPQSSDVFYYRVEDTSRFPNLTLSSPVRRPLTIPTQCVQRTEGRKPVVQTLDPDIEQVICSPFSENFDSMDDISKQGIIAEIIDTMPPVYEMKGWLEENTTMGAQASLRNWTDRISPAACGMLRWIIASNRSCIVPVDEVDAEGNKADCTKEPRVWGMGEYVQFRFAMGAPDKEQRFVKAVKDAQLKHAMTCKD